MPAFFLPNGTAFPIGSTAGIGFQSFRANNAAEVAHAANLFLRNLDNTPIGLVDFSLSAGGGGDVDLCVLFTDAAYDPEAGFPSTQICSFIGFENTDGRTLANVINADLVPPDPTKEVAGWSTATGAAAGKLCAVFLFVSTRVLARGATAPAAAKKPATSGKG